MRNVLIIVLCVFISAFFIVEKKKNKKSLPHFLKFEMFKIDLKKNTTFFNFMWTQYSKVMT